MISIVACGRGGDANAGCGGDGSCEDVDVNENVCRIGRMDVHDEGSNANHFRKA